MKQRIKRLIKAWNDEMDRSDADGYMETFPGSARFDFWVMLIVWPGVIVTYVYAMIRCM